MSRPLSPSRAAKIALLLGAILAGVATAVALINPLAASDTFWQRLRVSALEADHYSSLADMLEAADSVVIASIDTVAFGRTIHGDVPEEDLTYAQVNLRVTRVIAGNAPSSVPLEFIVGLAPDGPEAAITALQASIPQGPAIYFLHEKRGADERGKYRVTNSTGLWARTLRDQLDAPLREESPGASSLYAGELSRVSTIDELAELLASYASAR